MNEHIAQIIEVKTPSRLYDVCVGWDLLETLGKRVSNYCGGNAVHIISDTQVKPLYGATVKKSLKDAGYITTGSVFEAGEQSKTIAVWHSALEAMAEAELDRDDIVVALGGGVCGDLAGFAAATYMRGIQVVQVPTSLLAMVDSSVGGKTAVDLPQGKNLIGAFLQPSLVVADVSVLKTLSPKQFQDACGEIIKHAILASPNLLDHITKTPVTSLRGEFDELAWIVASNVEIKRDVVSKDETEKGLRQTLNLGHTIGHAIEAASNYTCGHGECVAAGLCIMARAAERMGWSSTVATARILECVEAHELPTSTDIDPRILFEYATHDKKRHAHTINIVVAHDIGNCEVKTVSLDTLQQLIQLGIRNT